ncbi:MAG TPA: hypothetical protein VJ258_02505 [Candidatus Limnocylindrales bacterium]|nr:hypothetical protein [Candidatus Limnocylindrales bacterium]
MFHRKTPQIPHTDLIDLLLNSDEPTRKLLIFQALQSGALAKSEAEEILAMASRLERAASPRSEEAARKAAGDASAQTPASAPAKAA